MKFWEVFILILFFTLVTSAAKIPTSENQTIPDRKTFALMHGNHFQGDMVLTDAQKSALLNPQRNGIGHGWLRKYVLWERGIVPYTLDSKFSPADRKVIEDALRKIESVSCIRFVRRKRQRKYVTVKSEKSGCWSAVGQNGRNNPMNLEQPGCVNEFVVIHEFLHALGFHHMQGSEDRDNYVHIYWENIKDGWKYAYDKFPTSHFGVPYDLNSIMHYDSFAFAKDEKKPTLVRRDNGGYIENIHFSQGDILRLNRMYRCKNRG